MVIKYGKFRHISRVCNLPTNAIYSLVNWFTLDDKTEHCLAAIAKKNVDVD